MVTAFPIIWLWSKFAIKRLSVPDVNLLTQDNAELLGWFKSNFKRKINWNKYEPKVTVKQWNQYLDFLINLSFKELNKRFVLSFEDTNWYYTTGCLLDYNSFNNYYKMIATDLSKQQALDAYPKVIHQINFTANLDWQGKTLLFLIIKEAKETILDFSLGTVKIL